MVALIWSLNYTGTLCMLQNSWEIVKHIVKFYLFLKVFLATIYNNFLGIPKYLGHLQNFAKKNIAHGLFESMITYGRLSMSSKSLFT